MNRAGDRVAGLGTDVVDVERFRRVLARTPRLLDRIFADGERAYAFARRDPVERLAVRFAAKEAVMKALGVGFGQVRFVDIEVCRASSGEPSVMLHGSAAVRAAEQGIAGWRLSMSHSTTVALAVVLALAGEPTS